jgi:hypothetical protein
LDKAQVVFHWYLAPTLDDEKARGALFRWMAGNETVKDLDRKVSNLKVSFEYFPLWYFKVRQSGQEKILLEPASATSVSELKSLNLPAGDLRSYDHTLDAEAHDPTVPLETALSWIRKRGVTAQDEVLEVALVHLPIFTFKYDYEDQTFTALVEAATGKTLANIFPAKAEAPYLVVGGLTAATFLTLACIPAAAVLFGDVEFMAVGLGACLVVGIPAAIFWFLVSSWIAAKV